MARSRPRRGPRPRADGEAPRRARRRARATVPTRSPTISARPSGPASCSPQAQGEPADYTFTHEQVRQFAASQLSAARRRQVHAAVVDLLLDGGDPAPAGLPMLAQHALAAGDTVRAARFSIDAATAALASNAPEEALRLVEQALPVVSTPADRRVLLATRDDAFAVLRRTGERLDGLTELAALAEAMRDPDDRARRPAPARVGAADEPRRGRRRGAGPSRPRPRRRARRRRDGAPGDARARPGAPAEPARRVVRRRRDRDRPRRRRGGLPPRHRARGAARRRSQPRRRPPRDRDDRLRARARVVRRRGPGRPGERAARGGGGGCRLRGAHPGVADRPAASSRRRRSSSGRSASSSGSATAPASCRRSSRWPTRGTGRSCTSRPRRGTSRRSGA